jgi:hypothetical protein
MKKEWLSKRIHNNNLELKKMNDNNNFFKENIRNEMITKGKTKKLLSVEKQRNEFFQEKINSIQQRLKTLNQKFDFINGIHHYSIETYISHFVKNDFIMSNDHFHNLDVIDKNYKNSGIFYSNIKKIKNKVSLKVSCKNLSNICEEKILMNIVKNKKLNFYTFLTN